MEYHTIKKEEEEDETMLLINDHSHDRLAGEENSKFENSISNIFTQPMEYYRYFLCILVWCVILLDENMLSFMLKSY